jgi:hypothetical protein
LSEKERYSSHIWKAFREHIILNLIQHLFDSGYCLRRKDPASVACTRRPSACRMIGRGFSDVLPMSLPA